MHTMDCVTFRRMRTVSKQYSRQSWHKRQECLILARKGPVRMVLVYTIDTLQNYF